MFVNTFDNNLSMGKKEYKNKQYREALESLKKAEKLISVNDNAGELYMLIADTYMALSIYEGVDYIEQAIIYYSNNAIIDRTRSCYELGLIYDLMSKRPYREKYSNYAKAIEYYVECIKNSEREKKQYDLAALAANNIGILKCRYKKYYEGLCYFCLASKYNGNSTAIKNNIEFARNKNGITIEDSTKLCRKINDFKSMNKKRTKKVGVSKINIAFFVMAFSVIITGFVFLCIYQTRVNEYEKEIKMYFSENPEAKHFYAEGNVYVSRGYNDRRFAEEIYEKNNKIDYKGLSSPLMIIGVVSVLIIWIYVLTKMGYGKMFKELIPFYFLFLSGLIAIITAGKEKGLGIVVFAGVVTLLSSFFAAYEPIKNNILRVKYPDEYYKLKLKEKADAKRRREEQIEEIRLEREEAIYSQKNGPAWRVRYMTDPCPYCGHYKVRNSKWEDKQMSVAFWGIYSTKLHQHYKCENCGKMW